MCQAGVGIWQEGAQAEVHLFQDQLQHVRPVDVSLTQGGPQTGVLYYACQLLAENLEILDLTDGKFSEPW